MCVLDIMERVIFAKDVYTSIASRFNFVFIFVYAHFPDLLTDFLPLHDVLRSQLPNLRQSTHSLPYHAMPPHILEAFLSCTLCTESEGKMCCSQFGQCVYVDTVLDI